MKIMNRFVLNETSYHGYGAISAVADEIKARGFMPDGTPVGTTMSRIFGK